METATHHIQAAGAEAGVRDSTSVLKPWPATEIKLPVEAIGIASAPVSDAKSNTELKLLKLLQAHERANHALSCERSRLQRRVQIQRKLITHLRNNLKEMSAQVASNESAFHSSAFDSQDVNRRYRVKSLNSALLRISGVESDVQDTTYLEEKIDPNEFLPLEQAASNSHWKKKVVAKFQLAIKRFAELFN